MQYEFQGSQAPPSDRKQPEDAEVDMGLFVMKPPASQNRGWNGGSVRKGICEAIDEAESDCDSEDDLFADILNMYFLSAWYDIMQLTSEPMFVLNLAYAL